MGTTSEKLTYLNTTKNLIKEELNLGGANITNEPFRAYKGKLEGIYKDFLANGTDVVWNNWLPKVTGSGETITLNNTIEAKMDFVYKGNTYQYSTTGYNLFKTPYNESSTTKNGITFTINEDGSIHVEGTATAKTLFALRNKDKILDLSVGETYTFVASGLGTINSTIWLDTYTTGGDFLGRWALTSTYYYATAVAQERDTSPAIYITVENGATVNTDIKVWLYKGSYDAEKDYEPYTNGASPNPDYPQDIQVVSGDNTIKVEGKNLFDGVFRQGNRFTDGLSDTKRLFTTQNYPVKSGVSYTLSTTINPSAYKWAVNLSTSEYPILNITPSSQYYDSGWKTSSSFTFTPSQDGYLGIVVAKSNGSDNLTPSDIANVNWQLEYGSSPSAYIPYQVSQTYPISLGNIELCKIGDYQDKIYKDNGKWYLNKQIGKVVLDGSESSWGFNRTKDITQVFSLVAGIVDKSLINNNFYSNYFINQAGDTEKIEFYQSQLYIAINKERASTLGEFKTWLSTHNTTVYYVLAKSTYTKITDTTLISQLEAIKKSYNTQTNISQENNDLPFELDVVVLGELEI